MKFRIPIIVILNFSLIAASAAALPDCSEVLSDIDPDVAAVLFEKEHVFRYDDEDVGVKYFPGPPANTEIFDIHSALNPEIMVEALYSIPYPDGFDPETDDINSVLFKLAHQVSSISGVKYLSERKNRYAVLFSDAYAVNSLEERKKIPDPDPPRNTDADETRIYMNLKESLLGRGYYIMDLEKSPDMFTISLTNESSLGFLFRAVEPQNLKIVLHFFPCRDRLIAYSYAGVVLEGDALVNLILDPYFAFYRRMTAMETWLYNSLHGTDRLPPVEEPMP